MQMLIATDGSVKGSGTAEFAALIARPAAANVTLLGLAPHSLGVSQMQHHLDSLKQKLFEGSACEVTTRVVVGQAEDVTLSEIDKHFYHLVAIGAYRRHGFRRFMFGSVARYLAQHVPLPLLVVNNPRQKIERILICTSGERPGEVTAYVGGTLAGLVGAQVTILHVMSQVALVPQAPDDLEEDAGTLMERRAREGVHLRRTLEILDEQGVPSEKRIAKVRHGLVVDEIVGEAREFDYDMVVMGAHEVPESRSQRSLRALLQENIADEVLTNLRRPMLIVRALDDKDWWLTPKQDHGEGG
jgi:nucleotide-binding universal stress UspA family protein